MAEPEIISGGGIQQFLHHLESQVNDRGVMADLRHGLSRATEYRAWPHIASWGCRLDDDRERRIWLTVAAGFAIHQRTVDTGNMGTVLRAIATGDGRGEKGLETFDARFRRLLACSSAGEACDQLVGVLRTAEGKNVPVNFARLFTDLRYWGDKVKVRWAAEYWKSAPPPVDGAAGESEQEEDSAAGSDIEREEDA